MTVRGKLLAYVKAMSCHMLIEEGGNPRERSEAAGGRGRPCKEALHPTPAYVEPIQDPLNERAQSAQRPSEDGQAVRHRRCPREARRRIAYL